MSRKIMRRLSLRRNRLVGLCGAAALLVAMGRSDALAAQPDKVLAKVGDRVITLQEFQKDLQLIPDSVRARVMTPQNLRGYLKGMVLKELFAREALRLGLEKSPTVQAKLEEAKRQILYNAFSEKVMGELEVSEEELQKYFEAHRGEFEGKEFSAVKAQVAQKVREAKLEALWERTQQEAVKRWGVTMNETLLSEINIPKDQTAKDMEKAIQEIERRSGPIPEEQKQKLREGNIQVVPMNKPR